MYINTWACSHTLSVCPSSRVDNVKNHWITNICKYLSFLLGFLFLLHNHFNKLSFNLWRKLWPRNSIEDNKNLKNNENKIFSCTWIVFAINPFHLEYIDLPEAYGFANKSVVETGLQITYIWFIKKEEKCFCVTYVQQWTICCR